MKAILISAFFLCTTFIIKGQSTDNLNQDGKHLVYYQNGNIKAQGNYIDNKREGEWLFYYENGSLALKKNFHNGEQIGEWVYYNKDGSLLLKVDDISKIDKNTEVALYENNKIKFKYSLVNGRKVDGFIDNNKIDVKQKF